MEKSGIENFDYETRGQPPFGKEGTNPTEKQIVKSFLDPIVCERCLKIINNLINDGYKIENILNNLENFTPKDTNTRLITFYSIDFFKTYSISKEDIPILKEILKIYDDCKTIYALITTPINNSEDNPKDNSEDNPEDNPKDNPKDNSEDNQLNIGVCIDYVHRSGEFCISNGNVDKLAHKYEENEIFRLERDAKVYSLDSEEKNINIDDLIKDNYIITKGTYVRIDYSNNNKYALYVKIKSETTGKEYITYSI